MLGVPGICKLYHEIGRVTNSANYSLICTICGPDPNPIEVSGSLSINFSQLQWALGSDPKKETQ